MYVHKYTVKGKGHFPLDMLRYDSSYPSTSEDVHNLAGDYGEPERTITLSHLHQYKDWEPTAARWASFGWQVNPHTHQSFKV